MPKSSEQSDKNLLKRSATNAADTVATYVDTVVLDGVPALSGAWKLAKALLGNALELRKQRALEFVEAIQNDPSTFNKTVVESEEFQDGFVVALTEYIKIRDFLKRRAALKIFKEFARSDDKVEFPLERFYDTLNKLSKPAIKTLALIKEDILPIREQAVKDDMFGKNLGTEKPYEWWYKLNLSREPVSIHFNKWVHDHYSLGSQTVKDKYNNGEAIEDKKLRDEVSNIEQAIKAKMSVSISELEYLGLIRNTVDFKNMGWGSPGGTTAWALSSFAYKFIEFIEKSPKDIDKI